ncbi:MAG: YdcH family protein [Pseudomonadota bacterium]
MFEAERPRVERLLATNDEFRRLYEKHEALNEEVDNLSGHYATEQIQLENLKKQKLLIKDQLAGILRVQC